MLRRTCFNNTDKYIFLVYWKGRDTLELEGEVDFPSATWPASTQASETQFGLLCWWPVPEPTSAASQNLKQSQNSNLDTPLEFVSSAKDTQPAPNAYSSIFQFSVALALTLYKE